MNNACNVYTSAIVASDQNSGASAKLTAANNPARIECPRRCPAL